MTTEKITKVFRLVVLASLSASLIASWGCNNSGGDRSRGPQVASNATDFGKKSAEMEKTTSATGENDATKKNTENDHKKLTAEEEQELEANSEQIAEFQLNLNTLKVAGELFCERLDFLQRDCVTMQRLVHDTSSSNLNCSGDFVGSTAAETQITVEAATDSTLVLRANGNYISEPFQAGITTIKFRNEAGRLEKAPRIHDLYSLTVEKVSGTEISTMDIFINGVKVIGTNHVFQKSNLDLKVYEIDLSGLDQERNSEYCQVPQNEISQFMEKAKQSVTIQDAKPIVLQGKALNSKQTVSHLLGEIDRETDRLHKLKVALGGNAATGCKMDEPIESLEIEIDGFVDQGEIARGGKRCSKYLDTTGDPDSYDISLGDGIVKQVGRGFLTSGGKITFGALPDMKIGDIRWVAVQRKGFRIFNKRKQHSGCRTHKPFEIERAQIDKVRVIVNGTPIYFDQNIGKKLEMGSLMYKVSGQELNRHPDWRKLNLQTSCTPKR